jgi:hypothetical protein
MLTMGLKPKFYTLTPTLSHVREREKTAMPFSYRYLF